MEKPMVGILGPMRAEVEALLTVLTLKEHFTKCGLPMWTGTIAGKDVVIAECGVGKTASGAATQALISEFGVTHLLNAGIAGGVKAGIKVGDVVLSTRTEYFDVHPQSVLDENFPCGGVYQADANLLAKARAAVQKLGYGDICHEGPINTGDNFVTDSALKISTYTAYSKDITCTDMEGGAMGHVAYLNQVPFLVIRVISDLADDNAEECYYDFKHNGDKKYEKIIEEILKNM